MLCSSCIRRNGGSGALGHGHFWKYHQLLPVVRFLWSVWLQSRADREMTLRCGGMCVLVAGKYWGSTADRGVMLLLSCRAEVGGFWYM